MPNYTPTEHDRALSALAADMDCPVRREVECARRNAVDTMLAAVEVER